MKHHQRNRPQLKRAQFEGANQPRHWTEPAGIDVLVEDGYDWLRVVEQAQASRNVLPQ